MSALNVFTLSGQGGIPDARQIIDASISAATASLNSPSAPFTIDDVGKTIVVGGGGAAGAPLVTTILSLNSSSSVELSVNASTTVVNNGATFGTECSGALQGALDAIADANGGTLIIDGAYLQTEPVSKDFQNIATTIRIEGLGSNAALYIGCDSNESAITLEWIRSMLLIEGVNFVGTPNATADAMRVLNLKRCWTVIRESGFYGLACTAANGSVIWAERCGLTLEDNEIAGCTANSGLTTSVVTNFEWSSFTSKRNRYVDVGYFNGIFHNKLAGLNISPLSWVRISTFAADEEIQENALSHSVARFEDDKMDEFALRCIYAAPGEGTIPHVLVDGVRFNVPMFSDPLGAAIQCGNVENVEILRSYFGYVQVQRSPVILQHCGNVIIDRARNNEYATGIVADDVACLTVKDSPGFDATQFGFTNVAKFVRINQGAGGVIPVTAATAISDSNFDPIPPIGTLGLDTATGDIYAKTQLAQGWVRHQALGRVLLARSIIAAGGSGVAAGGTRNVSVPGVDCANNPVVVSAYGGGETVADDAYRVTHKVSARTTSGCTVTLYNNGTSTQTLNADILVIERV